MRSLVYLDISGSELIACQHEVLLEENLPEWEIKRSCSLAETKELMDSNTVSVCIVLINENLIVKNRIQFEKMAKQYSSVEWVAILPRNLLKLSSVCQFIRGYFYDYHRLPLDYGRFKSSLGHAYGMANLLIPDLTSSENETKSPPMIGQSAEFKKTSRLIKKVSSVDAPVLITGESGTGKELVAQSIHYQSDRANSPFVAINCGAIPADLIQSELFGHEKGAFTGAVQKRVGRLESANGGTLFLDEIGDLPFKLQATLLRCLQEGVIERVGSSKAISLDLRVIAATNVDLHQAIREGTFREDLFYRLNVFNINMPPLRDRGDDAVLLAIHFLSKYGSKRKSSAVIFSDHSKQIISTYPWPGNIRELINRVKRAALLCDSSQVSPVDLGFCGEEEHSINLMTLANAREEADKSVIVKSLAYTNHNITAASKLLDISRLSLYRLISKYALDSK